MRRLATAAVLMPLVIYVVFFGPVVLFQVVVAALAFICFQEFANIAQAQGIPLPAMLGQALGLVFLFFPRLEWLAIVGLFLVLSTWALRASKLADALPTAAAALLGIVYVYGGWRSALVLREASPWWLMLPVSINWVGDSAAFFIGKNFGKNKLAPRVSPGKTWEGAIASAVTTTVYGAVLLHLAGVAVPVWQAVALSFVTGVAGQIGDLVESAMKRGAGVKDSGNTLPGHGGWLDRLDSTLFSMPLVALYLRLAQ